MKPWQDEAQHVLAYFASGFFVCLVAVFMHWHKSVCLSCASAYSGTVVYTYLGAVSGGGRGKQLCKSHQGTEQLKQETAGVMGRSRWTRWQVVSIGWGHIGNFLGFESDKVEEKELDQDGKSLFGMEKGVWDFGVFNKISKLQSK